MLSQLILRVIPDLCRHFLDLPSRVAHQRIGPQQSSGGDEESGGVNPRRIELSVQRAQDGARAGREVLCGVEPARRAKELFHGPHHRHGEFRELGRQMLEHLVAQRLCRDTLEQLEESPAFVVEPVEDHMLDAGAAELHDGAHRGGIERRVDHDRQGGVLPMDLLDYVDAGAAVDDGINDQDVRDVLLDGGSQFVPSSGGMDRMLRAENNCEMLEELTGEIGDDVHAKPDRMS